MAVVVIKAYYEVTWVLGELKDAATEVQELLLLEEEEVAVSERVW